ncbi:hypothetical protein EHQ47_16910 [Leptospira bourretii]|uniref:hypothetical protein n=1 Tax=Leptospira bourretii TaxID=2484962 RepID=UPI001090F16A|nr:hypothetical protein [Leptospira bourretii]TGL19777.1 hypothetical protein EHQ47_16910 [Leptospira bourretii]
MNKKIILTLFLSTSIWNGISSESLERKRINLLVSPVGFLQTNTKYFTNETESSPNIHFLYGITNNFFVGFNYGVGLSSKQKNYSYQGSLPGSTKFYNLSRSRNSETFSISTQYFFWGNFYGSLYFGFEKGYTSENQNYSTISGASIDIEPYKERNIFSDKYFGNLGIGFRKEFFNYIPIGFEFQYGYMEAGKRNTHITYNPEYYRGAIPANISSIYINENFFQNKEKNSDYYQINIFVGIAL